MPWARPPWNLAFDDERVDEVAGVVDRDHLQQPRLAGLAVHLQHRDVAPERVGVVGRLEERLVAQAGGEPRGQLPGLVGVGGDLDERPGRRRGRP